MSGLKGKNVAVLFAAGMLSFGLAACDGIFDTSRPVRETARVQVTGSSPVPLLLVTSDQFVDVYDPETGLGEILILGADTLTIDELPVDTTYRLGQFNQFLIRLVNPSATATADIRMVIRLDDDDEVYDEAFAITGTFLQYTYRVF